MIRNGRPYTNENGAKDDGLINRFSQEQIGEIGEWIKKNVKRSRSILKGHTSYGMKHMLEHDIHIYMTNNEFKDAMLLAGFAPVDPDELNWRYRIALLREENTNPSPFCKWLRKFEGEDSPEGDFAEDTKHDFAFPVFAEKTVIQDYLERVGACPEAVQIFEELWEMYEREKD